MHLFRIQKRDIHDYIGVSLLFLLSGTVFGFMLHAAVFVFLFFIFSVFYFFKKKYSFNQKVFFYYLSYILWLSFSYFWVGGHASYDFKFFIVYLALATGSLLILQSIEYERFKKIYLNIAAFIAFTSVILFLLHLYNLIPIEYVFKPGTQKPYMMFAFNNFGWFVSFKRCAGPYWEPGAFQIVLNYALVLYFEEISKLKISRNDGLKILCVTTAIIMTQSTAGFINLIILALIIIVNIKVKKRQLFKYICAGIVLISFSGILLSSDTIQKKFFQKGYEGTSYEVRQSDNLAMLQMTYEKPFVGYGLVSNEFRHRGNTLGNITSSNGLLVITSQLGIPFFICIIIALYSSLKRYFPNKTPLFLLLILLLQTTEVFFYFPISFLFLFNRRPSKTMLPLSNG